MGRVMAEHEDGWIGPDNWLVRELQKAFAERDAALARAEAAERRAGELLALLGRVSERIDALDETDWCTYYGEIPYALDREIKTALSVDEHPAATDEGGDHA